MPLDALTGTERKIAASVAVVVALTRLIPLSLGPWDWDEILFCFAVGDYDVAAHHPHPAGFPLFILLARAARFFTASDFQALQAVNVLASMLLFPAMFLLARAYRLDFQGAVAAGLLMSFLTNVWFYGGTAFSDPLAMVLFVAAAAFYLLPGTGTRHYLLGSIFFAAGLLVRPQNALVGVFPWTVATVRCVRSSRLRVAIAGSLLLVVLVAFGYGMAAYLTGVQNYVNALRGHSQYVVRADSVASGLRPSLLSVLLTQLDPFDAGKVMLLINVLALAGIAGGRPRVSVPVLLTFGPYFFFTMMAANPAGSSRFSLNYVAGMVILSVEGMDVVARVAARVLPAARAKVFRTSVRTAVLAVILVRLITWGLPAFHSPRTTLAPPTAAAVWLRDRVPVTSTLFVDGSVSPWVQYYTRHHRRVPVSKLSDVLAHPDVASGWYVSGQFPAESAIGFVRPRDRTWNIVTRRGFEAFVQPARDVVAFDEGWHGLEGELEATWRWSGRRAVVRFGPSTQPREMRMQFAAPVQAGGAPMQVTFVLNGRPLGTIVAQHENDVRYAVPAGNGSNVLVIEVDEPVVPARSGESHDTRELGIMLRAWSCDGAGS